MTTTIKDEGPGSQEGIKEIRFLVEKFETKDKTGDES